MTYLHSKRRALSHFTARRRYMSERHSSVFNIQCSTFENSKWVLVIMYV
jgi:hypothetical protein